MMFPKIQSANDDGGGDGENTQFLRDIEAISKALYLHNPPLRPRFPSSKVRSQSAGKTRFSDSNYRRNSETVSQDVFHKDRKSSSLWNWKKSLKALTHVGQRRFDCCFSLHVHSIQALPPHFNGSSLCIHWKRKDHVLHTRSATVLQGTAEFDQTLMHRCSVYGRRNSQNLAKYEEKLSSVSVSVVGAPGLEMGKHWVDLTRILPLSMGELMGERSSGKWSTSFKLMGKADGAVINISFSFLVLRDNLTAPSISSNCSHLRLAEKSSITLDPAAASSPEEVDAALWQPGSLRTNSHRDTLFPATSLKIFNEVTSSPRLELSRPADFLYEKHNDGKKPSYKSDPFFEHEPLEPKAGQHLGSVKGINEDECENFGFTVIEKGIEILNEDPLKANQGACQIVEGSMIEVVHVDEIIEDEDAVNDEENKYNFQDGILDGYSDKVVSEWQKEQGNLFTMEPNIKRRESKHHCIWTECGESSSLLAMSDSLEQENYIEVKSNYKAHRMEKKSLSLDDLADSVENDFLNLLGIYHDAFVSGSELDPDSPRERLLKEFEKEASLSGNFILDPDLNEESEESGFAAPAGSGCCDILEDFNFSSAVQVPEKHKQSSETLRDRRNTKFLENLENEALMRRWALNEKVFLSSSCYHSNGFGSPVELPQAWSVELPPLGDGPCSIIWTEDGGILKPVNPMLFRNAMNGARLIIQVSSPIVLPAELGSEIMEILHGLASVGMGELLMQTRKLMPLEDIISEKLHEVGQEDASGTVATKQQALLQHVSEIGQDTFGEKEVVERFLYACRNGRLNSGSVGTNMDSEYVSIKDLASLAIDSIEPLSIEGLKIQSDMSDGNAPSIISPQPSKHSSQLQGKTTNFSRYMTTEEAEGLKLLTAGVSDGKVDELLNLSLTLDEWLKLDTGVTSTADQISERTARILKAYHAKCIDYGGGRQRVDVNWTRECSKSHGLLSDNLTLAFRVQLRDPSRNFEPVGIPMLALVQLERTSVLVLPEVSRLEVKVGKGETIEKGINRENEEDFICQFKVTGLHLAGIQTKRSKQQLQGTLRQQQSGARWLLASGMGKANIYPSSKTKAIVRSPQPTVLTVQPDIMWSISSLTGCTGTGWTDLAISHVRNPDIIF